MQKFKGNFGELILNVQGNNAYGTYQKQGEFKGEFKNNHFKGQFTNNEIVGLLEFKINDNALSGTWKKGLEPGPMKGKWFGELIEENDQKEKSVEIDDKQKDGVYHPIFPKVLITKNNVIACSVASLIRHFIFVDKKIDEHEVNWLKKANKHYNELSIPLADVWDHVNEVMEEMETLGVHGKILNVSTQLIKEDLDDSEKNFLIKVLTEIVAADDVVTYEEFQALSCTVEQLYPGATEILIENLKDSGITVNN